MVIDKYTEKQRILKVIKAFALSTNDPINWMYLLDECVVDLLDNISWIEKEK